jgi:hypothetical protein
MAKAKKVALPLFMFDDEGNLWISGDLLASKGIAMERIMKHSISYSDCVSLSVIDSTLYLCGLQFMGAGIKEWRMRLATLGDNAQHVKQHEISFQSSNLGKTFKSFGGNMVSFFKEDHGFVEVKIASRDNGEKITTVRIPGQTGEMERAKIADDLDVAFCCESLDMLNAMTAVAATTKAAESFNGFSVLHSSKSRGVSAISSDGTSIVEGSICSGALLDVTMNLDLETLDTLRHGLGTTNQMIHVSISQKDEANMLLIRGDDIVGILHIDTVAPDNELSRFKIAIDLMDRSMSDAYRFSVPNKEMLKAIKIVDILAKKESTCKLGFDESKPYLSVDVDSQQMKFQFKFNEDWTPDSDPFFVKLKLEKFKAVIKSTCSDKDDVEIRLKTAMAGELNYITVTSGKTSSFLGVMIR